MSQAVLIYNPRAGRGRAPHLARAILDTLSDRYGSVEPRPTTGPGDATGLARHAAADQAQTVFALGGDGTLREVAAGLLGTEAVLGPIPGGTTNVVHHALGIPRQPLAAARALCVATVTKIDVGLCGKEPFLMQASAGLDALALRGASAAAKRIFGRLAILNSGLRRWAVYNFPAIDLIADGRPNRASFIAVCNLPLYGGAIRIAPAARPDDRALDLVLFQGHGRAKTLAFARDLVLGRHLNRADVELAQVQEVELRSPADLAVQIDGDAIDPRLPVTIRLAPERLRVLIPRLGGLAL